MTSSTLGTGLPLPPTTSPTNGPPNGAARNKRGLLDALLMVVLVYAVYAKTPIGAIVETGVNVARGQQERPSWLATFKGRETAVHVSDQAVADATAAESALPAPLAAAATRNKVDPEALASLFSVHGTCTAASCDMDAPPRTSAVLGELAGKTRLNADEVARALAAGQKQLENNPELAVEALWVGPIPVALAVEQARRSASLDPTDVEAHADFLSPSMRRGPLQGALAVMAVYRLRTLAWPADGRFRITSPYGERIHPVTGLKSFHNGTDLGVPTGTPLLSAHKGFVKRQSRDSISGNYVILDHGLGLQTTYCHMIEATVVEGARVKRKDLVGHSGATGRVTGPHLHYILRMRDQTVDPEKYGESPSRNGGLQTDVPPPPPPVVDKPKLPPKKNGAKPPKPKPDVAVDAGPVADAPPVERVEDAGPPEAKPAGPGDAGPAATVTP